MSNLKKIVNRISNNLTEKSGYGGVNLLSASDEIVGQCVRHIHIIPRKMNDGNDEWLKFYSAASDIEEIYSQIEIC